MTHLLPVLSKIENKLTMRLSKKPPLLIVNDPTCIESCTGADATSLQNESSLIEYKPTPETFPYSYSKLIYSHPGRLEAIVGPVIGVVTQTTARILLEITGNYQVVVTAIARQRLKRHRENRKHVVKGTKQFRQGIPEAITLVGLLPGTYYSIFVNVPTPRLINSGFRTRPSDIQLGDSLELGPLRFAIVSGNIGFYQAKTTASSKPHSNDFHSSTIDNDQENHQKKCQRLGRELWKDLYHRVYKKELDVVIHLGNLPYIGATAIGTGAELHANELREQTNRIFSTWNKAISCVRYAPSKEQAFNPVCELFRWIYRICWNAPYIKHVLANIPNYIIMNEGTLGRWKYPEEQSDVNRFITGCAYRIYQEYVENLVQDFVPSGYHTTSIPVAVHMSQSFTSDVGLLLLDLKACKATSLYYVTSPKKKLTNSSHKDTKKDVYSKTPFLPLLGIIQWSELLDDLEPGGVLDNKKFLFVSTQQRLSEPQSTWYEPAHRKECYHLLRRLFAWQNRRPFGHRSILLMATESKSQFSTGLADICINMTDYIVEDARQNQLRELSITGLGNLSCLMNVPNLQTLACSKEQSLPKYRMLKETPNINEQTDLPTYNKPEGDTNIKPDNLRTVHTSKHVTVVDLGEEFIALHYPHTEMNCYGLVTVETKYILPNAGSESNANSKNPVWSNYIARPAIKTQIIGADFNIKAQTPIAGIRSFAPVWNTEAKQARRKICCCNIETSCNCAACWVVE